MIDTYNYLATTFYSTPANKQSNTSHNKKELKSVYNSIVKMNRESPLYMFNLSEDTQKFAVDVKESAYSLMNTLDKFSKDSDIFNKTTFTSSNSDKVSIDVTDKKKASNLDDFFIRVDSLATNQVNEGRHVYPESSGLTPGKYSFNISVYDDEYSYQFPVSAGMNNYDIQSSLADFITSSDIGLKASVETDSLENKSYLVIESDFTGSRSDDLPAFTIEDNIMVNGRGISEYFGLDNVSKMGSNAHFNLDGTDRVLHGNTFTYDNSITITLNDTSSDPVLITKSADADTLVDSLSNLTETYNALIETANNSTSSDNESTKLLGAMRMSSTKFRNSLEACGINFDESGKMVLDSSLIYQAVDDGDLENLLTETSGVVDSLKNKANSISLNPMEFVKKTIVTYPNVSKPGTTNPYMTSIYSGMLFNYYC